MAGEGERMQLRSMVDKDKENSGESSTTKPTQGSEDELDDIRRAVRVSNRRVMMFWYIPDLKKHTT